MGIQNARRETSVQIPPSDTVAFNRLFIYVQQHKKREKAFPDFSDLQLYELLVRHATEKTLHVIFDKEKPVGVVVYKVDYDYRELFVYSLLCDNTLAFKTLIAKWKEFYPGWSARSHRRERKAVVVFKQNLF
jgi:hypothetical protein